MSYIKHSIAIMYDNIADMLNDTKLKPGMVVGVLGYHSPEDGAQSYFSIKNADDTLVVDNGVVHELINGLYAVRTTTENMTISMYGAYGDGVQDDTEVINKYLESHDHIVFDRNKVYNVSSQLTINRLGVTVDLNGSTIKYIGEDTSIFNITHTDIEYNDIPSMYSELCVVIKNGILICNNSNKCMLIDNPITDIKIDNIEFRDNAQQCVFISKSTRTDDYSENVAINISNCKFNYTPEGIPGNKGIHCSDAYKLNIDNTIFNNQYYAIQCSGDNRISVNNSKFSYEKYPTVIETYNDFKPRCIYIHRDNIVTLKNIDISNYHTVIHTSTSIYNAFMNIDNVRLNFEDSYKLDNAYFIYYTTYRKDFNTVDIRHSEINASGNATTYFTNIAHTKFISKDNKFIGVLNTPVDSDYEYLLNISQKSDNYVENDGYHIVNANLTSIGNVYINPYYTFKNLLTYDINGQSNDMDITSYPNTDVSFDNTMKYYKIIYDYEQYELSDYDSFVKLTFDNITATNITKQTILYFTLNIANPYITLTCNKFYIPALYLYNSNGDRIDSETNYEFTIEFSKPEINDYTYKSMSTLLDFSNIFNENPDVESVSFNKMIIQFDCKPNKDKNLFFDSIANNYKNVSIRLSRPAMLAIQQDDMGRYSHETNNQLKYLLDKFMMSYNPTLSPLDTYRIEYNIDKPKPMIRIMSIPWISDKVPFYSLKGNQILNNYRFGTDIVSLNEAEKYLDIIPQQNGFSISKKYNTNKVGFIECNLFEIPEQYYSKSTKYYYNADITTNGKHEEEGSLYVYVNDKLKQVHRPNDKSEKVIEIPFGYNKIKFSIVYSDDTDDNFQDLVMYVRNFYITESPYEKIVTIDCEYDKNYDLPIYKNGHVIITPIEDTPIDVTKPDSPYKDNKYLDYQTSRGQVLVSYYNK